MADLPDPYYTHAAEVLRKAAGIPSMLSLRRAEKRRAALIKRKAENEAKAEVCGACTLVLVAHHQVAHAPTSCAG